MRRSFFFLLFLIVAAPFPAFGWGGKVHEIIVRLALREMRPETRTKLYRALGTDDPYQIGHWADSIREFRAETRFWHYVNIPKNSTYSEVRDCHPSCVVSELARLQRSLVKPTSQALHKEDLLFFIHLIADLEQPFHCYDDHDNGANDIEVAFGGERMSLHSLWDQGLGSWRHISAKRAVKLFPPLKTKLSLAATQHDLFASEATRSARLASLNHLSNHSVVSTSYLQGARKTMIDCIERAALITRVMLEEVLSKD